MSSFDCPTCGTPYRRQELADGESYSKACACPLVDPRAKIIDFKDARRRQPVA